MLRETLNTLRDLPRLKEIAAVLIRYGFGELVLRLKLPRLLERAGHRLAWPDDPDEAAAEAPVRARHVLENLGATFIKLGQVLSTRVDVFPPDWIAEFEKLQHRVPSLPFSRLEPGLVEAFGQPLNTIFQSIDPEPIGSASIAQVHTAVLLDGTPVVLKIRRPGIGATVEADLGILQQLARLIELEFPEARRYQPVAIVAQFARSLRRELDFVIEARNLERFAKNFAGDPQIVIPALHWQWTRASVNCQSLIDGIRGHDLAAVDAAGLSRKRLAEAGARAVLKMILVDGFFHADLHPGNVFYLRDGRLAFVDFGMVGRLPAERREQICDLLAAVGEREEHGILEVLLDWTGDAAVDEQELTHDIAEFMFSYEHVPLREIDFGQMLHDIIDLMRRHSITLPADLTLLFKALITLEGLGRQLDPDFHMVEFLTPFVRKTIVQRYRPRALLARGRKNVSETLKLLSGLPHDINRLLKQARRGKLSIDLDLKRLDHFGQQLDRSTNRLTLGIVTSALIIGSSIVMTVPGGPHVLGMPFFGFLGFIIAFATSLWLIFSIWRAGKDS